MKPEIWEEPYITNTAKQLRARVDSKDRPLFRKPKEDVDHDNNASSDADAAVSSEQGALKAHECSEASDNDDSRVP